MPSNSTPPSSETRAPVNSTRSRKRPLPITAPVARATCEALRFTEILDCISSVAASSRQLADANLGLLRRDPRHASLQFKKVGHYWSVRVGLRYRALSVEVDGGYLWFWSGSHSDYDRLIQ